MRNLIDSKLNYVLFLLILAFQLSIGQESKIPTTTFPMLLEAENASYSELTLKGDGGASNGQYLSMGESGQVTWTFSVVDSGWYKIHIGYRNTEGESVNPLIQNGVEWPEGFGWSSDWNNHEKLIALDAVENIVQLVANYGNMDIDYLIVDTITTLPKIKPEFNNFYLKSPRDIKINMHAYGRKISSVKAGTTELNYSLTQYPFLEDTWEIMIDDTTLATLAPGIHNCSIYFENGESVPFKLELIYDTVAPLLTIIAPHIEHGTSVLVLLPTGKTMLIDCGYAEQRDNVVIPLLHKHNIHKLDYFILTHYHDDHDGGDDGLTIKNEFDVGTFYDYQSFSAGDVLEIENTRVKILNAYAGPDENQSSLCFKMEYNGFIYVHGGDIYATQQRNIMSQFPADVKAHVYASNHHFHGSTDVDYMRLMDPYVVFIQAQEAIYARSTYTQIFQIESAEWLRENDKRFLDEIPSLELGTLVIRANSGDDWTYETHGDSLVPTIPYLQQ